MSAVEVCDRLDDRFRLLTGPELGPGSPGDAAARGGLVLRPAGRRRAGDPAKGFGVLRWLRPAGAVRRCRGERRHRGAAAAGLVGAQVPRHCPPRLRADPVQPLRDHPDVRRRAAGGDRRARGGPRPACGVLRRRGGPAVGALERSRVADPGRLGADGAGEPTVGVPVEPRPRSGRDGHRRRRPRRPDGVLRRAVRDHRLGRGCCSRPRSRPMSGGSPGCTPPRGMPASSDGPRSRPRTPIGPPSWRADLATSPASPATRRSSRPSARSTAATWTATSS